MKTEINGDFKGYLLRFKLASKKCFFLPIKSAIIIFFIQLLLVGILSFFDTSFAAILLLFVDVMLMLGYYLKVLYKNFWNVVLEESKGLFADLIMWIYYILVCLISLSPALIFLFMH